MALLTAGYWQTTYFPSNYWQEDYWPEYGAVAPSVGDKWLGEAVLRKRLTHKQKQLIKQFLEEEQSCPL